MSVQTGIPYDLHIHSCLSPCGDSDMTVNNIVNMSLVQELQLIALTDHNSCKNCPAILRAARGSGIVVLPGMELTTSEEIHVICLFPGEEEAMAFDRYVESRLLPVQNAPDIFGPQQLMDSEDNITGEYPLLLINATTIPIGAVGGLVGQYGGICYPAHIDKDSYSILSSIGAIPPEYGFTAAELAHPEKFPGSPAAAAASGLRLLSGSDAHYLWDIAPSSNRLPLRQPSFEALAAWLHGE